MKWNVVALGVIVLVVVAVGAFVVTRPVVQGTSTVDADVTVRCEASAGSVEACVAWGDAILADGPPSTTFEMQDVARLVIRRPMFGLAAPCQVDYFLQRYPDDPVWNEDTPCRDG